MRAPMFEKKFDNWFQPLAQPADQQIFDEIVEKNVDPRIAQACFIAKPNAKKY